MTVRKNDKAVRLMVAEIAGRLLTEVHAVEDDHGEVIVVTGFTTLISIEVKRIEIAVGARIGRSVSLC